MLADIHRLEVFLNNDWEEVKWESREGIGIPEGLDAPGTLDAQQSHALHGGKE